MTACRHVLSVNRSMVRMTELVELAITCETMLRSAPNCAPSIGRMKRRLMRISIPYGSNWESRAAKASGSTPTAMRPPSRGGIGNMLKTANTTLMISAFFKFSVAHCAAVTGRYPTR